MSIDVISSTANKGMQVYATAGQMQVLAYLQGLLAGENQTVNRMMAGSITSYGTVISSTTTTVSKNGATVFYGVMVLSSGSGTGTISVWDGTSTGTGTTWWSSAPMVAAPGFIPAAGVNGQTMGVLFNSGVTILNSSSAVLYPLFA